VSSPINPIEWKEVSLSEHIKQTTSPSFTKWMVSYKYFNQDGQEVKVEAENTDSLSEYQKIRRRRPTYSEHFFLYCHACKRNEHSACHSDDCGCHCNRPDGDLSWKNRRDPEIDPDHMLYEMDTIRIEASEYDYSPNCSACGEYDCECYTCCNCETTIPTEYAVCEECGWDNEKDCFADEYEAECNDDF